MQEEKDKSTIIIEDINNSLLVIDRSRRQKLSKNIFQLNSSINQLDLINIYRLFYPTQQNTHSPQAHIGTFTKKDHKIHVNKCKRRENYTKYNLRPQWN